MFSVAEEVVVVVVVTTQKTPLVCLGWEKVVFTREEGAQQNAASQQRANMIMLFFREAFSGFVGELSRVVF